MPQKSVFSTLTPLPPSVTRKAALAFVHNHATMIRLNPLVVRHETSEPHDEATVEERRDCTWYRITDKIALFPGLPATNEVTYLAAFYDLPDGLQTHVFAPGGVDIRGHWRVGGNLPGEPREPRELGATHPVDQLYLQENVVLRCNMLLTRFVKRNLIKAHAVVVNSLVEAAPAHPPNSDGGTDVQSSGAAVSTNDTAQHNELDGATRQTFAAELDGTSYWPPDAEPLEANSNNTSRP